jgi:hypothetical protein
MSNNEICFWAIPASEHDIKICTICGKNSGTGRYVDHPDVDICTSCMLPKDGSKLGSKNNVEELQKKEAQIIKSKEEAKIIVLENLLRRAICKIEFLHGCLTRDDYKYAYPKMTLDFLEEANPFAPKLQGCYHSIRRSTCPACAEGDAYREKLAKAKEMLK